MFCGCAQARCWRGGRGGRLGVGARERRRGSRKLEARRVPLRALGAARAAGGADQVPRRAQRGARASHERTVARAPQAAAARG